MTIFPFIFFFLEMNLGEGGDSIDLSCTMYRTSCEKTKQRIQKSLLAWTKWKKVK